ncbi:MAG: hypothetical protein EA340_08395 [Nitriliruptor sp.]|nr:MAG: hypothetical protein EA340_08395 [Nitriliruptor sp.]
MPDDADGDRLNAPVAAAAAARLHARDQDAATAAMATWGGSPPMVGWHGCIYGSCRTSSAAGFR